MAGWVVCCFTNMISQGAPDTGAAKDPERRAAPQRLPPTLRRGRGSDAARGRGGALVPGMVFKVKMPRGKGQNMQKTTGNGGFSMIL